MARRSKKPPPRVYHDGLIPTTPDTYPTDPELVPADHDPTKHEKSYPELAPPPPPSPPPPPLIGLPTPPTAQTHVHPATPAGLGNTGGMDMSNMGTFDMPFPPALTPLPRPSGVHSLRQAWSEIGSDEVNGHDENGGNNYRGKGRRHVDELSDDEGDERRGRPVWKRGVFWVGVLAVVVVSVLAGVLGGVASGRVRTVWDSDKGGSYGTGSLPSVTDPTCPGASNRNYTSTTTSPQKTFRVQCDADYPGGDGELGSQNGTVVSMAACLDACAQQAECVGAVFKQGSPGACWLKQFIGLIKTGEETGGAMSGILWQ